MTTRIFISYRHVGSASWPLLIQSELARLVHEQDALEVFLDTVSTGPGVQFRQRCIEEAKSSHILIAIISPGWTGVGSSPDDPTRRRIDSPDDLVVVELAVAKAAGASIIPVFVEGARWSDVEPLPESLSWLIDHRSHNIDVGNPQPAVRELAARILSDRGIKLTEPSQKKRQNQRGTGPTVIVNGGNGIVNHGDGNSVNYTNRDARVDDRG